MHEMLIVSDPPESAMEISRFIPARSWWQRISARNKLILCLLEGLRTLPRFDLQKIIPPGLIFPMALRHQPADQFQSVLPTVQCHPGLVPCDTQVTSTSNSGYRVRLAKIASTGSGRVSNKSLCNRQIRSSSPCLWMFLDAICKASFEISLA